MTVATATKRDAQANHVTLVNEAAEKLDMTIKTAFGVMVINLRGKINQAELADTISTSSGDKKHLADIKPEGVQKASDFEDRRALRAQEVTTLENREGFSSRWPSTARTSRSESEEDDQGSRREAHG